MSHTVYIQISPHVEVHHPEVCLQDVAKLSCAEEGVLQRLRTLPILEIDSERPGRYVLPAMELIEKLQKEETDLEISLLGETDLVITYEKEKHSHRLWAVGKAAFVCLVSFFGAAFGIMTFNTDVGVKELFAQIYWQVTGARGSGYSVLEISYSIGIGLGVLFFFNHFGHRKITGDPSPMQMKMRQYEEDVNAAIIKEEERRESQKC